jgi:hypothetical protein
MSWVTQFVWLPRAKAALPLDFAVSHRVSSHLHLERLPHTAVVPVRHGTLRTGHKDHKRVQDKRRYHEPPWRRRLPPPRARVSDLAGRLGGGRNGTLAFDGNELVLSSERWEGPHARQPGTHVDAVIPFLMIARVVHQVPDRSRSVVVQLQGAGAYAATVGRVG